jgi:hypothetical protein
MMLLPSAARYTGSFERVRVQGVPPTTDVDAPAADPAVVVAAALEAARRDRAGAAVERQYAGEELAASQLLFAHDDRRENEHRSAGADQASARAGLVHDSSGHRRASADSLAGAADQMIIDACILADGENAKHPRAPGPVVENARLRTNRKTPCCRPPAGSGEVSCGGS